MIGQLYARIECLQSYTVCLPAADWLITNGCFNPIGVSSHFSIAHFMQMKKEISNAPMLAYYNLKKQTVLQTDASIKHLGACLLQEEKPVYFASKALREVQK